MPKRQKPSFLILDACVVIDYAETDLSVLAAISTHVAPIALARPVLNEVEQLDEGAAADLGMTVVDVELELASKAAQGPRVLSFEDRVCLLLAKREDWTCVTNDRRLRRACAEESVRVMWGLEMMLRGVAVGVLSPNETIQIAEAMHHANPRYVTQKVVAKFTQEARRRGR